MIPGKNGRVRKVARPAAGEPVVASGGAANSAESRYNLEGKPANSGITIPTLLTLVRVAAVPALVSGEASPSPPASASSNSAAGCERRRLAPLQPRVSQSRP